MLWSLITKREDESGACERVQEGLWRSSRFVGHNALSFTSLIHPMSYWHQSGIACFFYNQLYSSGESKINSKKSAEYQPIIFFHCFPFFEDICCCSGMWGVKLLTGDTAIKNNRSFHSTNKTFFFIVAVREISSSQC